MILADVNGFYNFEIRSGTFLWQNAGELNKFGKRRCAAVHRRNFFRIDIDEGIIDAQTPEGRKHVFGRLDLKAIGTDGRAQLHGSKVANRRLARFDVTVDFPPEHNAVVRGRRGKADLRRLSGMETGAGYGDGLPDGLLPLLQDFCLNRSVSQWGMYSKTEAILFYIRKILAKNSISDGFITY